VLCTLCLCLFLTGMISGQSTRYKTPDYAVSMPLITLNKIFLTFGDPPLLDGVDLQIQPGERLCLLGRNGTGKSTLMKIMVGMVTPDRGEIIRQKHLRIVLLGQDIPEGLTGTVHEVASEYVPSVQAGPPVVDTVLSRMQLESDLLFETLSVGLKRRTLLAQALAAQPDVLLLDEPTNHLDIEAITWLESFLLKQRGSLLFVTHDRLLTQRLATRILNIDQGRLTSWDCDYPTYLQRREAQLEAEAGEQKAFDRKLDEEEVWIRQGIRARRTRDEGRVRALERMRKERANRRAVTGAVRLKVQEGERTSRCVIEAKQITFGYDAIPIVDHFSVIIQRGDKVGFIGPNGVGKTTLLRLLLGELEPQQGTVEHGLRLQVAYFDQLREQLDDNKTVFDTVAGGNDHVMVNGNPKHVISYLKDFLFTPARSRSDVRVLSGGERNRLLLAKLFTQPANVLALDEPTNDLDTETLEILESMVVDFPGTILLISHDRVFLDHVATSTIAFEGAYGINEYVGGYNDWLRQRPEPPVEEKKAAKLKNRLTPKERGRKLSYKEQKELNRLPAKIDHLEAEQQALHETLANPASYRNGTDIPDLNARLETMTADLETAYARWEGLEAIRLDAVNKR